MNFLLGVFIGLVLSSKNTSNQNIGVIQFMTIEDAMNHKDDSDPFEEQDNYLMENYGSNRNPENTL